MYNGKIGLFLPDKSVKLTSVKNALKALKANKLDHLIRTKTTEEVDKEAIKMNPKAVENIKSIKIKQEETFKVTPKETQEPVTEIKRKLEKEI